MKYRIKIEQKCRDCEGNGRFRKEDETGFVEHITCSECDGTGYTEGYTTPQGILDLAGEE